VTGKRGSRCKQLLDDFKENKGYWKLGQEALTAHSADISLWKWLRTFRKTDYGLNDTSVLKTHEGTPEGLVPVYQTTRKYITQHSVQNF
jgi:hypothetical protein